MQCKYLPLLLLPALAAGAPAPPLNEYATRVISTSGQLFATSSLEGYIQSEAKPTQNTNIEVTLVPGQDSNSNGDPSLNFLSIPNPQPIRGNLGASDPGPHNSAYDQQNPDTLSRPSTDTGDVQQSKWPMGLSSNRMTEGGWARQQNIAVLPAAKEMAGVDMRLKPNAYRELHCTVSSYPRLLVIRWLTKLFGELGHTANEWAYVFNGSCRISAIDSYGRNFIDDVSSGDLWYFPSGLPHSIQALENGCEFLLVFDDGNFSEDETFLITEWFSHTPREVLSKNFGVPQSAFKNIPKEQLYIFNGTPAVPNVMSDDVASPYGKIPSSKTFSYHFSEQEPMNVPGGSVKIVDSGTFGASENIAAALVTIKPGAMRELH